MSRPLQIAPLTTSCSMCDDHLLHCHGTAIVIDDDEHFCSDDPDCTLGVNEHWFMAVAEG